MIAAAASALFRNWPAAQPFQFRLLGVRGYYDFTNPVDVYNDLIAVLTPEGLHEFQASVDPGKVYIDKPINPAGCARLQCGLWSFRKGQHRGHDAFIQASSFTVDRLNPMGEIVGSESGDNDTLGIHLHSGGTVEDHVGSWSAGCQIIYSPEGPWGETWQRFLTLAYGMMELYRQETIPYLLVDCLEPLPV